MDTAGLAIDLNADVGEGRPGDATDEELLAYVTSVHVACGFHAGDASTMRRLAGQVARNGVTLGAHPSYPDRDGFGRRPMDRLPVQIADDVVYQVAALDGLALKEGTRVRSVKPHGALYHRLATDPTATTEVAAAVARYDAGLRLVLMAGSPGAVEAASTGLTISHEGFCDRAYCPDGSLVERSSPGAVLSDPSEAARRAVSMVLRRKITAIDGSEIPLVADTICVHGDTPGALAIAAAVRAALEDAGVLVASPSQAT